MRVAVDHNLSKINRRLYRQGRTYTVKVDLDAAAAAGTKYNVYAIADTWMLGKAWNLAKKNYDEQLLGERNVFDGKMARWRDFRLDLSDVVLDRSVGTSASGVPVLVNPTNGAEFEVIAGEYLYSTVADDSGVSKTFGLIEATDKFNILKEFDLNGTMDTDPENPTTQVAYDGLDTDLQDTEVEEITGNGNEPPYAQNNSHYNNPFVKIGELGVDIHSQRLSTGYFDAPLGFVVIVADGANHKYSGQTDLTVCVKAGDYKGVHAPSLME